MRKHNNSRQLKTPVGKTLMISQHGQELWVSMGTYTQRWLDYIFSQEDNDTLINSEDEDEDEASFLTIREYGRWMIRSKNDLYAFSEAIVAIILNQLRGTASVVEIEKELERLR
ncbi:hypothetical protein KEM55_005316, partial [Ascosphaera atra]